jgi:HAD superfamily hydrolase (TIGR01509 family)
MYKKVINGKKAVFFDLDGTVVKETEDLKIQALQKVLDDIEASYINANEYRFDGYPFSESWKVILAVHTLATEKKVDELIDLTDKTYIDLVNKSEMQPTEGFWDLVYELKEKKQLKLALLTNTKKSVADVVIDKLEIRDVFDLILCGDEVRKIKPNPEIYKKALKFFKLRHGEVVAFEDSLVGAEASAKARVDTVIIWDRVTPKYQYKGKIIDFFGDFSPLPGNLDEFYVEYMQRRYREIEKAKKQPKPTN